MASKVHFQVKNICNWTITVKVLHTKCIQGIDETFDVELPPGGSSPEGDGRLTVTATQSGNCAFEASQLNIGYWRNTELVQAKITEDSGTWSWDITDDRYIVVQHLEQDLNVFCRDED